MTAGEILCGASNEALNQKTPPVLPVGWSLWFCRRARASFARPEARGSRLWRYAGPWIDRRRRPTRHVPGPV